MLFVHCLWVCSIIFIPRLPNCLPGYSSPVDANWDPSIGKECGFDVAMIGFFLTGEIQLVKQHVLSSQSLIPVTAYGAFLDFFLAGLPWYILGGLHIKQKEKITICISLSTGIL